MENQGVYGQNMLISQTFIATDWKGVKIKHIHTFPAAVAAAHWGVWEYYYCSSKIDKKDGEKRRMVQGRQPKNSLF